MPANAHPAPSDHGPLPVHASFWLVPAGERDLMQPAYWEASLERVTRRRAVERPALPVPVARRPLSVLLAASALVGPGAGIAAAHRPTSTTSAASVEQPPARSADTGGVRALQQALGVSVDGVLGPQTRAAIRSAERAKGLLVDGRPDAKLRSALGVNGPSPTADATDAAAPPTAGVAAAVAAAMTKVGSPYDYGATGPSSFDCSGLVVWAMRQAGVAVPRTSFAQYGQGRAVASSDIRAGDLVFFDTAGPGASDVGLATGPDTVVSATTRGVMVHPIRTGYWGSHLVGARRVA